MERVGQLQDRYRLLGFLCTYQPLNIQGSFLASTARSVFSGLVFPSTEAIERRCAGGLQPGDGVQYNKYIWTDDRQHKNFEKTSAEVAAVRSP
jgi:hypothetical protein